MGITRKKRPNTQNIESIWVLQEGNKPNTQNIATAWVCQTEKSPHTHSETQHGYEEEKSCHIPTNIESERVLQAKRQANTQNIEPTWVLQERSKQIPKT